MLNRGILCLLIVTLALLASPATTAPVAAAPITWLVGANSASCGGDMPDFTTITEAILTANAGDTIHVCPGAYTEDSMTIPTYKDHLTIEGSGASVTHVHWSGEPVGSGVLFTIQADYVVIQGLDVDAAPPHSGDTSTGLSIAGDSVTIQNNEIRNANDWGVRAFGTTTPRYVQILSNNIHGNFIAVECHCDDSAVSGNTVSGGGWWPLTLQIVGNHGVITNNIVSNGGVTAVGDDLLVSTNQISAALNAAVGVAGVGIEVTDNTVSDTAAGYAIWAEAHPGPTSTSVTIARNTVSHVGKGIYLYDANPSDAAAVTATIGGTAGEANTFIDSGGSLGDSNYLVQMDGAIFDVDAEYNNWGLCTAAEIEQEIYDKADDPALGAVDFEPFIAPSGCSATPTPTVTPTRTPTATPGGTATPIPGPTRTVTIPPGSWANFTWTGNAVSPEEVAHCYNDSKIAVMYRLDTASGTFQRWIRDREELSNMGEVMPFDALLALNAGAQPATCTMPDDVVPYSLTIPAGRWANFAWLAFSFPGEVAPDACSEGSIAVIYRLDAATQTFQRWIRGRPELSNMTDVQPYDALLALNGIGQASTCTFSHYGQLMAGSS